MGDLYDGLEEAVHYGGLEQVKKLQEGHPPIHKAFCQAIVLCRIDIVRWYLDNGIDPDMEVNGLSLSAYAYECGYTDLAFELWDRSLTKEKYIGSWFPDTLLGNMVFNDQLRDVQRAIQHGVPWQHPKRDDDEPLVFSCHTPEMLQYFIALGVDANMRDKQGFTLLQKLQKVLKLKPSGRGPSVDRWFEKKRDATLQMIQLLESVH